MLILSKTVGIRWTCENKTKLRCTYKEKRVYNFEVRELYIHRQGEESVRIQLLKGTRVGRIKSQKIAIALLYGIPWKTKSSKTLLSVCNG